MAPLPVSTEPNYLLARVSIVRLASLATPYHRSPSSPRKVARMTTSPSEPGTPARRQLLTRRNLIASTGLVAAAVTAAPLLGRGTAEAAEAAVAPACPPGTTAPVPPPAKGPAIPTSGYLVEEVGDRVFWLAGGLYQMIFMTTAAG